MKKYLKIVLLLAPMAMLILLFTQQSKLEKYLSKAIKLQLDTNTYNRNHALVDSLYNYSQNEKDFQITFLEFGTNNCVACKKMLAVMEELEDHYPHRLNVQFLNILKAENQELMKYYGLSVIPTQILLDREGKPYFRHSGYISFVDIKKEIDKQLAKTE